MANDSSLDMLYQWVENRIMEYSSLSLMDAQTVKESNAYFSMFLDLNFILEELHNMDSGQNHTDAEMLDSVSKEEFSSLKKEYRRIEMKLEHLQKLRIFQQLAKLEVENNQLRKQLGMDEVDYAEIGLVRKPLLSSSHA